MKASLKKQYGVTLLETLLVFVIITSFLVLGIQTYRNLVFEQQLRQVKYNIDTLFQGLRTYYLANCRANRDYATGGIINTATGNMDVARYGVNSYFVMTPPPNLTGYLTNWPPSPTAQPPFVTGYITQFNLQNAPPRNVNFCYQQWSGSAQTCGSAQTVSPSLHLLWVAQVSIKVDPALAQMYKGLLNAECVSTSPDGIYVIPCKYSPAQSNYLVFTRLPSMSLTNTGATMWVSNPNLKNFTQQYTNDEDYAVTENDASYHNITEYQDYLCGG